MSTLQATRQAIRTRILADTVVSAAREAKIAAGFENDVATMLFEAAHAADKAAHIAQWDAVYTVSIEDGHRLSQLIDRQVYRRRRVLFPQQYH